MNLFGAADRLRFVSSSRSKCQTDTTCEWKSSSSSCIEKKTSSGGGSGRGGGRASDDDVTLLAAPGANGTTINGTYVKGTDGLLTNGTILSLPNTTGVVSSAPANVSNATAAGGNNHDVPWEPEESPAPTATPSYAPTTTTPYPTQIPTPEPTKNPVHHPTPVPTSYPTYYPTPKPTGHPVPAPSHADVPDGGIDDDDTNGLNGNWTLAAAGGSTGTSAGTSNIGDMAQASCSLMKRTFASSNAAKDAKWAVSNLGWTKQWEQTYTTGVVRPNATDLTHPWDSHDGDCATRVLMSSLGSFGIHFFQSYVTPQGDRSTDEWIDFWTTSHNFSNPAFTWDAWMANAMTFFVPEIGPFLAVWDSHDTPWIGRYYTNPADGATLYSAFVQVPHTGVIIELVTSDVSGYHGKFHKLETISCPESVHVSQTTSAMKRAWESNMGSTNNAYGFPDMLLVRVSAPTETPTAMGDFLREFADADLTSTTTRARDPSEGEECVFSTAKMSFVTPEAMDDWHIDLRMIRNPWPTEHLSLDHENHAMHQLPSDDTIAHAPNASAAAPPVDAATANATGLGDDFDDDDTASATRATTKGREIGRASCRERV